MLLVDTTMGIATDRLAVRPPANEDLPESPLDVDALLASYYALRERFIQERDAGNYPEAFRLSDAALALAERIGDEGLVDQAYCNRFGFALAVGSAEVSFPRLREILMRNRNLRTCHTAANHLAFGHSLKKEYKKALFYAQISRDRACAIGDANMIARSHGEIGRFYLCESHLEKALAAFETALATWTEAGLDSHPTALCNMGYAKLVQRDFREGFSLLFESLRRCRSQPAENTHEWTHLFLCFGFTEVRRWRYAWRHGCIGLDLAEKNGEREAIKCALYLLGELEKTVGDSETARKYYTRLQREYYPEVANMANIMLCCDTKELVNLRA
jgi:tetratricopeptide (TPR) repeat protein